MKAFPSLVAVTLLASAALGAETPFTMPTAPAVPAAQATAGGIRDHEELAQLFQEDQTDRQPAPGQSIDWSRVIPRDQARQKRVKELYYSGQLNTGTDYYNVAMVLQHGKSAEDFLLAHELCIVAIIKGEKRATWLAAASEDRFLMNIGRPQRFGTQHRAGGSGPGELYKMDDGVTDAVRREFNVAGTANR